MKAHGIDGYRLLHEGALALARVEAAGMRINRDYLRQVLASTETRIREHSAALRADPVFGEWRKRYGDKTKLNAPEQLANVLFGSMGYEYKGDYTATGKRKADEAQLRTVDLPFVRRYLKYRKLQKLHGTYLTGLLREVSDTGFLHPFFSVHKVRSFRSSSDLINFQNIPIRNKFIAKMVRRAFVAREGRMVLEVDLSGAEVRASCPYHHDPGLIRYVTDPSTDMHRDSAADLFHLPVEFLKKHKDWAKAGVRDWAKNRFVFPEFYGSVYFQCAPHLWQGVESGLKMPDSDQTLQDYLKTKGITGLGACTPGVVPRPNTFEKVVQDAERAMWDRRFPVYSRWRKRQWEDFKRRGWFDLLSGFRVENVHKRNDVINYPVQGFAFHWLLWGLIQLQNWMRKHKMKTLIVGQIHDSMVLDAVVSEIPDILAQVKRIFGTLLPRHWPCINVPVETEAEAAPVGGTWHDKGKFDLKGMVA